VTAPAQRSAVAALETARPIIARLNASRSPEDTAADILEGWEATQAALRSLIGGSPLSGQALIRELRQRDMLTLDQAHALLEFLAARDRVDRPSYRPTMVDVQAACDGFKRLDAAVTGVGAATPAAAATVAAPATVASTGANAYDIRPRRSRWLIPALVALVLLLGAGGYYMFSGGSSADLTQAESDYAAGRREAAKGEFAKAARDNPRAATPHIYLGRIAREEGDMAGAARELTTAVQDEPNNALALREMGSYLFAAGNFDLARKFYIRALQANPSDRTAQGFLGCSMLRLGRAAEAQTWLSRAGQGSWSACAMQPPVAAPPAGP
jgi:tetratricopeptide (TPR) repeat protein